MLDPHHSKGKYVSYVLRLEGDEHAPFYIYCGSSQDIELRMLAATGIREYEQAAFCKLHPPTELLSLRLHESMEEAVVAETALYNLWAGKLGDHNRARGGRMNGINMPYPPRGWPRGKESIAKKENEESTNTGD